MAEHIERKCRDCFHYNACKAMLDAAGLGSFVSEHSNAERCKDFVSSTDVAPVVHGRWIDRPGMKGQVYCSECATIEKSTDSNYKSQRCPNCGAQMDKEEAP